MNQHQLRIRLYRLKHEKSACNFPLHSECKNQCRSSILSKCIELYPEALAKVYSRNLLLNILLGSSASSIDDAVMMMEKYPAALHIKIAAVIYLHSECDYRRRCAVIAKCIELYPNSLAQISSYGYFLLHICLYNETSSIDVALMLIEKYPAALQHLNHYDYLHIHVESRGCLFTVSDTMSSCCYSQMHSSLSAMRLGKILAHHVDSYEINGAYKYKYLYKFQLALLFLVATDPEEFVDQILYEDSPHHLKS
jgi:hypothetical protein